MPTPSPEIQIYLPYLQNRKAMDRTAKAFDRTENLLIKQKSYRQTFLSQKRAITTFLLRKFMITRLPIAFEDFLGSSIAPQVMPPCLQLKHVLLSKREKEGVDMKTLQAEETKAFLTNLYPSISGVEVGWSALPKVSLTPNTYY